MAVNTHVINTVVATITVQNQVEHGICQSVEKIVTRKGVSNGIANFSKEQSR